MNQAYTTVKVGDNGGNGQWRNFSIVLTEHESIAKKLYHEEEAH